MAALWLLHNKLYLALCRSLLQHFLHLLSNISLRPARRCAIQNLHEVSLHGREDLFGLSFGAQDDVYSTAGVTLFLG